jgi:hypothetical protein
MMRQKKPATLVRDVYGSRRLSPGHTRKVSPLASERATLNHSANFFIPAFAEDVRTLAFDNNPGILPACSPVALAASAGVDDIAR